MVKEKLYGDLDIRVQTTYAQDGSIQEERVTKGRTMVIRRRDYTPDGNLLRIHATWFVLADDGEYVPAAETAPSEVDGLGIPFLEADEWISPVGGNIIVIKEKDGTTTVSRREE